MSDRTDPDPTAPDIGTDNLFKMLSDRVFRYAMSALRYDSDRAKDVVQQVFTAVLQQYDRDFAHSDAEAAGKLIMTIAARRVFDMLRQDRRTIPVADHSETAVALFGSSLDHRDPLERILDERELHRLARVLMMTLTENEYQIALMAWWLGIPDAEIAQIMGVKVTTVRSHKSRAKRRIRAMVSADRRIVFPDDLVLPESTDHKPNGGELGA